MALSNLYSWSMEAQAPASSCGTSCGASDKPAPAACGTSCGASDKPAPAACGTACGAGDKPE